MKIAVVVRQVPDLIEPLEVAKEGNRLSLDGATFIVNESDEHALEQALLLKEAGGGQVAVVALDFGEVDNTLYTAAAKGAEQIVKIPWPAESAPNPRRRRRCMPRRYEDFSPISSWWASVLTTNWMGSWRRSWPLLWPCPTSA